MSRRRYKPIPPHKKDSLFLRIIFALGATGLGVQLLYLFSIGMPLVGRGSKLAVRDFHEYGAGALAVEHVAYLSMATWLFGGAFFLLINPQWYTFTPARAKRVTPEEEKKRAWILRTVFFFMYAGTITPILMLMLYGLNGVPYRNFQANIADEVGYVLAYAIPLLMLAMTIYAHKNLKKYMVVTTDNNKGHRKKR